MSAGRSAAQASAQALATQLVNDVLIAVSALPETLAYRSNSGLLALPGGGFMRVNVPGIGDISGVRRGRGFSLECKWASGRPSKTQRAFRRAWEAAGGYYAIVRSPEAAVRGLMSNSFMVPG